MTHTQTYLSEAMAILKQLDSAVTEAMVEMLVALRERKGRLFILGVGGGAGYASHAVSDFRKIAGLEAYAPTDNVSELTARVNDDGWDSTFVNWLKVSRLNKNDMLLVLSVGGGDLERKISPNLVYALQYAKQIQATICGIVGRDGGYTAKVADACLVIPVINPGRVTFHTEGFQALVWHLLVSHPSLKASPTKWEALS